jgi:hypothetical protein
MLTLAWYYTGKADYARHAAKIVKTWFTDLKTAINPNLNQVQIGPYVNNRRSIGIIEFSQA